jgi:hypothetical protein
MKQPNLSVCRRFYLFHYRCFKSFLFSIPLVELQVRRAYARLFKQL